MTHGLHLGVADNEWNTLLHTALVEGHEDCALSLIEVGAVDHALNQRKAQPGDLCCLQ